MISETDPIGNTKYFGYNKNSEIVSVTDRNGNTTEYTLDGKKLYKTIYSWDAEGNLLTEMQYNHGQSSSNSSDTSTASVDTTALAASYEAVVAETSVEAETPTAELPVAFEGTAAEETTEVPALIGTEVFQATEEAADSDSETVETPSVEVETPSVEVETPEVLTTTESTDTSDSTESEDSTDDSDSNNPEGFEYGNGNGEVPPGLNRRDKTDKEENPNPPETPENPGTEDSDDAQVNSAGKGTHIYTYDELNRMVTSDIAKVESTYTYDTLGNLIYEKEKNVKTDYQYNELNQLVSREQGNESYSYSYDKRGNRIAEAGKKETRGYIYDETNHLVEGTNWKGDKSAYTYNGLDVRINNTQTAHSGSVYSRDHVIDYTSLERDDLMVFAEGDGQLDYVQREVYARSERIEQFTDRSSGGYENSCTFTKT